MQNNSWTFFAYEQKFDINPGVSIVLTCCFPDRKRRGYSFGVFTDPPGQVWPNFVHETDEVVVLTEGEIELSFDGKRFRPAMGEEVFIPAKTSHTVENVGSITNEWLYGYKNE